MEIKVIKAAKTHVGKIISIEVDSTQSSVLKTVGTCFLYGKKRGISVFHRKNKKDYATIYNTTVRFNRFDLEEVEVISKGS